MAPLSRRREADGLRLSKRILKATYFPPQDPWFAGGYINYYYFGLVVIGWPIKGPGIDPAVAYNIALPTLVALTAWVRMAWGRR